MGLACAIRGQPIYFLLVKQTIHTFDWLEPDGSSPGSVKQVDCPRISYRLFNAYITITTITRPAIYNNRRPRPAFPASASRCLILIRLS
jgi:hypothetical protein